MATSFDPPDDYAPTKLEVAFDELIELPPADRAARLAQLAAVFSSEDIDILRDMVRVHELGNDPLEGMVISMIPDFIGKYEIRDMIGQGGMGIVYEAWDPNLQRTIALKIANPFLAGSKDWMRRFLEEARTLAQLDCDYVAKVNATGEDEGIAWVDMELVDGPSLQDHVREHGLRPVVETLHVLERVAQGLVETHRKNIVHRDLKPDNIILHPERGAVIIDFGIAHTATEGTRGVPPALPDGEADLTTVAGTPDYASPEQLRREPVDERADIWGLGGVAYFCLTGESPFPNRGTLAIPNSPDYGKVPSDTPKALVKLIQDCLEADRDQRPSSAGEFLRRLREIRLVLDLEGRSRWSRLSRQGKALAYGALVSILTVTVVLFSVLRTSTLVSVEVDDGNIVHGVGESGKLLWTRSLPGGVAANLGAPKHGDSSPLCIVTSGDRTYAVVPIDPTPGTPATLYLLDGRTGETVWTQSPRNPRSIRDQGKAQRFTWERIVELEGEDEPVILVEVRQSTDVSSLEFLRLRDGEQIGLYLGPNNLLFGGQFDLDDDGRREIYLYGASVAPLLLPEFVDSEGTGYGGIVIALPPVVWSGQGYPYSPAVRQDWPDQPHWDELRLLLIPPLPGDDGSAIELTLETDAAEIHTYDNRIIRTDRWLEPQSITRMPEDALAPVVVSVEAQR